jgi:hypothetical protein
MAIHENRLRAELGGGPQRHGGMHPEFPGFVRSRRNHAALLALPAYYHRLAFEGWIEQFFD